MNEIVYAHLIAQIGSVCFYECKSQKFLFGKATYYWKYMNSADFFGPFNSLMETCQHFDHTIRTPASVPTTNLAPANPVIPEPHLNNLIKVDFKSKKRIK